MQFMDQAKIKGLRLFCKWR
ncbi:hypothetical protein Goshw_011780 [Gossypium schwendimanii]|uniref:Uncharacterized protein n=1 Tax=Gossypium schwendimanii TaxID=34291 RepID=A0A7J9MHD9_GOSSC|nr:hypothetical protein [Gossypium schwendimanii]